MKNRTLRILKGEYYLNFNSVEAKLIVFYSLKKYKVIMIGKSIKEGDSNELQNYAKQFAIEMIRSKSDRDFYKEFN